MDVQTAPSAWPPPYGPMAVGAATGTPDSSGGPAVVPFPPTGWPSKDQLDYTHRGIVTVLLMLAVPYLAFKLLTDPGYLFAAAGRHHLKPDAG